jgi:hypothetical protein
MWFNRATEEAKLRAAAPLFEEGAPLVLRETFPPFTTLTLEGGELPEQAMEAGAELRVVTTRYPGGRGASAQVMGVTEGDITLHGVFRDVERGQQGWALAQHNAARALLLGGRIVELSWGDAVVRRGLVRGYTPSFNRVNDIGYQIVFEVHEADEAVAVVLPTPPTPPESDAALAALLDALALAADAAIIAVALINVVTAVAT